MASPPPSPSSATKPSVSRYASSNTSSPPTSTCLLFLVPPTSLSPPSPPTYHRIGSLRVLDGNLYGSSPSSLVYTKNYSLCPRCSTVVSNGDVNEVVYTCNCYECGRCNNVLKWEGDTANCPTCNDLTGGGGSAQNCGENENGEDTGGVRYTVEELNELVQKDSKQKTDLFNSLVNCYLDPSSPPPPQSSNPKTQPKAKPPPTHIPPLSLYTVRSSTQHLQNSLPGILAKRGVDSSWRKSTSLNLLISIIGRSKNSVVFVTKGVEGVEGYEGGEEGDIYDDLEESLDWDVIEEGSEWSWTGGVAVELPEGIENNKTVRHVFSNGAFKYFHAHASVNSLVKFKVKTVEGEEIKGCVWRRGEYKRREQVWRQWAYRGAVGVVGEGGEEKDEEEDEISFKPSKGMKLTKQKETRNLTK
ncbi:hypothetical protein TrLO_g1107 [Triparma laevis f. longispina]|uniref:Uncharacterized protein n=1 Tax=Triparma laevis f. longispina TaxID=1714387 RepID=A0A9W7FTE3_9STRA|nr:hypothetical protein TrLO_g1107 [Triparma laevis f. longispina]